MWTKKMYSAQKVAFLLLIVCLSAMQIDRVHAVLFCYCSWPFWTISQSVPLMWDTLGEHMMLMYSSCHHYGFPTEVVLTTLCLHQGTTYLEMVHIPRSHTYWNPSVMMGLWQEGKELSTRCTRWSGVLWNVPLADWKAASTVCNSLM